MSSYKHFWQKFYSLPLDKIPWQKTQADWFKELVDKGRIKGKTALDLGCGTGAKSIYLAKAGFEKVVGVDISQKAIEYAKENAQKAQVEERCRFVCADLLEPWRFVNPDEKFDFVLDWATIHGLPLSKVKYYAKQIDLHTRSGSLLLIRAFYHPQGRKYFIETINSTKQRIYFYTQIKLEALFANFKTLAVNFSQPRTKPDFKFVEVLLKKKAISG